MSDTHSGSCFCGAVQIEVTGEPAVQGYCHCSDCASWAAAPINAFSLWPPQSVRVTAGEELLGSFARSEASHRKFCTRCGGHVMTDHPGMNMVDVYLNIVPGKQHEPTLHVYYGERTVSVKDGLPKYRDLPGDFGGSDEQLPE